MFIGSRRLFAGLFVIMLAWLGVIFGSVFLGLAALTGLGLALWARWPQRRRPRTGPVLIEGEYRVLRGSGEGNDHYTR
jgi:hypothetical protein